MKARLFVIVSDLGVIFARDIYGYWRCLDVSKCRKPPLIGKDRYVEIREIPARPRARSRRKV